MAKKLTREQAAMEIVRVFADYELPITVSEASRVIDMFAAFKDSYDSGYRNTGCTAQRMQGTNGAFTTAVFTGTEVPEGTTLYIKTK